MKYLKQLLKWLVLAILIFLASLGIGLTGAAPLSLNSGPRKHEKEVRIEVIEERKSVDWEEKQ